MRERRQRVEHLRVDCFPEEVVVGSRSGSRAAVTMPAGPRTVCPQLRTRQRSELAKSANFGSSLGDRNVTMLARAYARLCWQRLSGRKIDPLLLAGGPPL